MGSGTSFSQEQYRLYYEIKLMHEHHSLICKDNSNSYFVFTADDGYKKDLIRKESGFVMDEKKSIIIEGHHSNSLVKCEINLDDKLNWFQSTFIGCNGATHTYKEIPLEYPYSNKFIKNFVRGNNGDDRVEGSYLKLELVPIYKFYFAGNDDKLKNGIEARRDTIICRDTTIGIKATSGFPKDFYKWEFKDPVNQEQVNTDEYEALLKELDKLKGDYEICKQESLGGSEAYCQSVLEDLNKIKYKVETFSPKTRGESIWRPIPSKNEDPNITISLSELYPKKEDQDKAIGKIIYIRLNPDKKIPEDRLFDKNGLRIEFKDTPPQVIDVEYPKLKCSNDSVKKFTMYFDRNLKEGQKGIVNVYEFDKKGDTIVKLLITKKVSKDTLAYDKEKELYKYTSKLNDDEKLEAKDGKGNPKKYRFIINLEIEKDENNNFSGCEPNYKDLEIKAPPPVEFKVEKIQDEKCFNAKNGKIKITATGGNGKFKYSINEGNFISFVPEKDTIADLAPKQYTIKVQDQNGCEGKVINSEKDSAIITIEKAKKITHKASVLQHPGAPGKKDGAIDITKLTGGKLSGNNSYKYKILLNGNSQNVVTGTIKSNATTTTIGSLPAGKHTIIYTDDNGCEQEYILPELIDPKPITAEIDIIDSDCYDKNTVVDIKNIKGGYSNYKATLKKEGTIYEELSKLTTETSFNIKENGTYLLEINDSRSGSFTKTITVSIPKKIVIKEINYSPISCYGETTFVEIIADGGSGEYEYAILKNGTKEWQSDNTFNVSGGNYRFEVRDKNASLCISETSKQIEIEEPDAISINVIDVVHNEEYFGEKNGRIEIEVTGRDSGYDIEWSKVGNYSFHDTGKSIEGLAGGTYRVVVSDDNNCQVSKSIKINQPDKLRGTIKETKQILCKGGVGTLKINSTGGVGTHTYQWYKDNISIDGAITNILEDVQSGNYSVEITDKFISKKVTKTFKEPDFVEFEVDKTDISCYGKDDGSIILKPSGGSGAYFYSIDDKKTYASVQSLNNSTLQDLKKGTYTVWIKDSNECESKYSKTVEIQEPEEIKIFKESITHNDIAGESKGSIAISVSGVRGTPTFLWTKKDDDSFKKETKDIDNLTSGLYTIKVKDSTSCSVENYFEIKEPLPIKVALKIQQNIACNGENTAKLLANVTGGYPIESVPSDFKYKWYLITKDDKEELIPRGNDSWLLENLKAGKYKIWVSDSKGATTESKIEITEPSLLSISVKSISEINCFGDSTGNIDIAVSGGTPPYQYHWSKKDDADFTSSDEDLTNIKAGTYHVKVIDSKSCSKTIKDIIINQPLKPLKIESSKIVNLKGYETNDGSITIEVSGGTKDYTYEWKLKGSSNVISRSSSISNLKKGEYEITILDKKGCSLVQSYKVIQPDRLEITEITQSDSVLCHGDTNISLTAVVKGGVKPYNYKWYKNDSILSEEAILKNVGGGLYSLKIVDTNGIKTNYTHEVKQPDSLKINVKQLNHVACYDGDNGKISIEVKGGVPPYTYSWQNGATGSTVEKLRAGTYHVTVRDKYLCEISKKIVIKQPNNPIKIKESKIKDATGYGLSNGRIEVSLTGGEGAYTYQWTNSEDKVLSSSTNILDFLKSGVYKLNITDANNCKLEQHFTISQPPILEAKIKADSIACFGGKGSLSVIAKGGVSPYLYRWYKFKNDTIIGNSSKLSDISSGIYRIEVEDANKNIVKYDSIVLNQPNILKIEGVQVKDATCYGGNDGQIELNVSGGVTPYTYIWSNGSTTDKVVDAKAGIYKITVIDSKGCSVAKDSILVKEPIVYDISKVSLVRPSGDKNDGSIKIEIKGGKKPYKYIWKNEKDTILSEIEKKELTSELLNIKEGKYTLSVIDSIGCVISRTYNLANPGELLVSIKQIENIRCHGGSNAVLNVVTTGSGGNTYTWYNAKTKSIVGNKKLLINIPKGAYYVVVSDAFGMKEQSAVFEVSEPEPVKVQAEGKNTNCFGGKNGIITLNASGGNGLYQYRYRIESNSYSDWKAFSEKTGIIDNLEAGTYQIQVRDTNNCFYGSDDAIESLNIVIEQPEELHLINESILSPSGFGLSNGSIQIEVAGGTPPYKYKWMDINGNELGNSNSIVDIKKGKYQLIITDKNECSKEFFYEIEQPEKLEVVISPISVISCKGMSNGSLRVKAQGGNSENYTYKWYKKGTKNSIGTGLQLTDLGEGVYYVEVEDANKNKAKSTEYHLTAPSELTVDLTSDYKLCGRGDDWTIKTVVSGGTPPYAYLWNNKSNTPEISNIPIGSYEVTVVDAHGCKSQSEIKLVPPKEITIKENVIKPTCFKGTDGSISLEITGGTSPYTYEWTTGESTRKILGQAGKYKVTVTDSKGCSSDKTIEIPKTKPLKVDLGDDVILCNGQTYILDGRVKDGVSYQWTSNNGFTSEDSMVEVSEEGVYKVISTNKNGCEATGEIKIKKIGKDISAEFIVSSQVFTDDSIIAVNVSKPKPDETVWGIPKEAKVIEENDNYCEIKLSEPGEYEITLYSITNEGCEEYQSKKILVLEKDINSQDEKEGYKENMIKSFIVYPNPSTGRFSAKVELREENPIDLKIYSFPSNMKLDHRQLKNDHKYEETYNLNLPTGMYFVILETVGAKQVKKIIIQ